MFFKQSKIEKILKTETGQAAIMKIDEILSKEFYTDPSKLSEQEKNIVYIEEMEREVNNGGFNQFFFNTSGDYTNELINSLKEIKSKIFLKIVEEAIMEFPGGIVPSNSDERQKILEEIQERSENKWEKLTQDFFKYEEDLYSLMIKYINENIEKFR